MTHLWDTDTSVYYLNGNEKIARKMAECGLSNICVTSVTVAELIFGAYNSQRIEANLARVDKFREQIIVLKTMTHEILDYFGKNKAFLKQTGQLIGDLDIFIASFAQAYNLTLVTNNLEHFQRIPELKLENWL